MPRSSVISYVTDTYDAHRNPVDPRLDTQFLQVYVAFLPDNHDGKETGPVATFQMVARY
jgi:hypothetical protein